MRILCLSLCLFALTFAIAPAAMAQDSTTAAMSGSEDAQLAARAAQAPDLANFVGGDEVVIIYPMAVVMVVMIVLLIVLL